MRTYLMPYRNTCRRSGSVAFAGTEAPVVVNGRVYLVSENRIYIFTQRT